MTIKEIEEHKRLIVACQERVTQAQKDYDKTTKEIESLQTKLNEIWHNEHNLNNEINNLDEVVVAELDVEELANELGVLDENKEPASHFTHLVEYDYVKNYPIDDKKIILNKKKSLIEEFNFKTEIHTGKEKYVFYSQYSPDEKINGKPLIDYFKITSTQKTIYPGMVAVYFGFNEKFYKNHFKVRLTHGQMRTDPILETAVMNILKRHEKAENV